jgi:hypothetical protein
MTQPNSFVLRSPSHPNLVCPMDQQPRHPGIIYQPTQVPNLLGDNNPGTPTLGPQTNKAKLDFRSPSLRMVTPGPKKCRTTQQRRTQPRSRSALPSPSFSLEPPMSLVHRQVRRTKTRPKLPDLGQFTCDGAGGVLGTRSDDCRTVVVTRCSCVVAKVAGGGV